MLGIVVIAISVWGALVYGYFRAARQTIWAEIREHLTSIAQAIALSIDPNEHQQVYIEGREDSPLYQKLTKQLQRFAHSLLPEVREKGPLLAQESIYTLVPSSDDTWHYVLDSGVSYDLNSDGEIDEEEDKAHLGEPCDVSEFPEMRRCFLEGKPTADKEFTKDKWGVWLSGYAPVKDQNGQIVAVVGVDFNVSTVLEKERRLRQIAWLVFAILSNLTLIVTLLFNRLRSALQSLREKADALTQAKADWELTFDLIGTGIAILDENFTVLQFNEALTKLIGKSEGELVGKRCNEVLHPELTHAKNCPYEAAIKRGETVSREVQLPDGRIFFIQAKPNFVEGKLRRVIHSIQDVTAERRARQLLEHTERLVTIGQMAAGVAHEINNPLNVIVGMAELLYEDLKGENERQMAERIREQALRIGRITKNLLTFARPRPQEFAPIDVNELVREVLEMKAYHLRSNNIAVVLNLSEEPLLILGDKLQLQQALLNIVNNAEDAMSEQGGSTLTITTEHSENFVRLTVEDTGTGIPPEHLPHIFDPFFTTKPVGKGTGLGLAIVYGIVTGHGGRIWAENKAEGGARFVIEFPTAEQIEKPSQSKTLQEKFSKKPTGLRILIVDDEPGIASVLKAMLSRDGHEVEAVTDGLEVRRLLLERDYDMVLCDLKMPKVDGTQIYRWVQEFKPSLASRFIVMTGDFLSPTSQRVLQEWRLPVLHKPFRMDELRALLERLL